MYTHQDMPRALKPLKRPRLGIPDVYPQQEKQKEDELTMSNVKHGFTHSLSISEEFGTARNSSITASKVGAYFNGILAKKEEFMTLPDSGRKKQQINPKDNFWPVTGRTKQTLDNWFKDLAGNKPLASLAKKAPSFNKKEEIFVMLCENQVTMQRATWFIKLSSAYTVAVSEAKIKKRSMPDPATEWTGTLIKFLKDLIPKLQEHYHQGPLPEKIPVVQPSTASHIPSLGSSLNTSSNTISPSMSSPVGQSNPQPVLTPQEEQKLAKKQWNYCTQLAKYMYEEGLLDKHEFLNWVLDLLDKMKSQTNDDGILRLFLPITLQYLHDFVQSERLCRRLAYLVSKKLMYLINNHLDGKQDQITQASDVVIKMEVDELNTGLKQEDSENKHNNDQNTIATGTDIPQKAVAPYDVVFNDYLNCPHHHDLLLQLSTILQVITIECPTALVRCGIGENRVSSILSGSPLDNLPVPPSSLPMPSKCIMSNNEVRRQLLIAEENIRQRSKYADQRWCADKWQTLSANSNSSAKILSTLDALDSHSFDRVDSNNCLETLYPKIFSPLNFIGSSKENSGESVNGKNGKTEYDPSQDAPVVQILCEWAVSWQRWGEHRAMAVALLLDKRQNEITSSENENGQTSNNDDKDSICSGNGYNGVPVFQHILMNFLDNDAPVLDHNPTPQNKAQFTNLVHLFSELIRHDVFSHDAYMCTLISRGDLLNDNSTTVTSAVAQPTTSIGIGPISNTTASPAINTGLDDDMFGIDFKQTDDLEESKVDMELGKLLQHIKEDQQNSMDAPDSPKEPDAQGTSGHIFSTNTSSSSSVNRHFLYTTHFPLSQDDPSTVHDCNQRYILLFGVGRDRDEKRHAVKKISKEICKLFSKKFSIDVAEGCKVKKHSRNEFNFESVANKCQTLSYFDQHVVTWQCAMTVQEILNSFAVGNSNYLPVQEHVAFLFDLMETAFNIYGLIDMCIQILKELPEVETQLVSKNSIMSKSYTTSLSLYVVGVLRRYHCCLLLSSDQVSAVFEGLCKVVKHVTNPSDCSSAERCILAYLYDLYSACSLLKTKPQSPENFHNAQPKIKQALYSSIAPQPSSHPYNPQFLSEVFSNPRRGGKIELAWARLLTESAANRYSFVCNAIIAVARETDNDRLNDIAATCAELTACCNALSAEWLGVLIALCGSSIESGYYVDVLMQVNIQNLAIHNSIAVFTCILVARHCFSLESFVGWVALPPLVQYVKDGLVDLSPEAEAGPRLSCHLLLRLFKTSELPQPGMYSVSTSPNPMFATLGQHTIKLSCDRHLLTAAHKNVSVAPVLAVLKGILVFGDATAMKNQQNTGKKSGLNTPVHPGSTPKSGDLSQILGTSDLGVLGMSDEPMLDLPLVDLEGIQSRPTLNRQQQSVQNENTTSLSDFAQHVLKQICSQEWVLERCLSCEELCKSGMLIDNMLTARQAQKLLHMICYSESEYNLKAEMDQQQIIARILENLDQWSLRISFLDLQLMYKQTQSNPSEWLDIVARSVINVFKISDEVKKTEKQKQSIWLIAPLVSKLPSQVQGRILRVAGQVLESTDLFNSSAKTDLDGDEGDENDHDDDDHSEVDAEKKKSPLLNHQPFLGLILTCLKGQDEQKEGLLQSLHSQLNQFVKRKEMENIGGIEDPHGREEMLEESIFRFSLIGGMFDAIQKNSTSTTDWALLFVQLISQGVIDLTNNSELFTTVLDMLATLIHSTLVSDSQSERDENKKLYTNLMKKLKKELGDANNASIKFVRQLLPLSKQTCEVIACEPLGAATDAKGNKITGFDSIDKKHGLRLADKQRVSVWDLLEGSKNPAPLSWAWFGAVKMERKPLMYEEAHRLLRFHTHSLVKPSSYFYEPLQLPPEDLEPEKLKDDKADTPSSLDQSPAGRGKGKGTRRPRKPKQSATATPPVPSTLQQQLQSPSIVQMQQIQQQQQQQQQQQFVQNNTNQMMMNQNPQGMNPQMVGQMPNNQQMGGMPNPNGGMQMQNTNVMGMQNPNVINQQQWGYPNQIQQMNPGQQAQQQQGQPPFYQGMPQQMRPVAKAITNMLRQRHPTMGQGGPMFGPAQQNPPQGGYLRHQLRMPQVPPTMGMNPMMNQNQGVSNPMMNSGQQVNTQQMNTSMVGNMQGGNIMTNQQQLNQGTNIMNQGMPNNQMMNQQMSNINNTNMPIGGQMNANQTMNIQNQNQMGQGNAGNNQAMYQNMQGMNQNYGYGNQQQGNVNMGGNNMMGNFQQQQQQQQVQQVQVQQRTQQEQYLAQQRAMQANRGQYMQGAPNVTMNQMAGQGQGQAPPYRAQMNPNINAQQAQQFRLRQQMMMQQQQQQQQNMGQQQNNQQAMMANQSQGMNTQQPSALVAQLQRQMPNQQQNIMNANQMPGNQMAGGQMGGYANQQPPPY